jgi:uncharacterized protein YecE (DUF72 family)
LPGIRRLAEETEQVHVLMNNCREDQAVVNAKQLATMLGAMSPDPHTPSRLL